MSNKDILMYRKQNDDFGNKVISAFALVGEIIIVLLNVTLAIVESIYRKIIPVPEKSVKGEVVLITGTGHGLGRELALLYAAEGATVICVDVNESDNKETVETITRLGHSKTYAYTCDVADYSSVDKLCEKVQQEVGDVTILINNAGVMPVQPFLEQSKAVLEKTINVNVMAHFWMLQKILPTMLKNNYGHIVAISSLCGLTTLEKLAPYCGSKFAVRGFMESLRKELVSSRIKTTTIYPYIIDTGLAKTVIVRFPSLHPILKKEDVAKFVMSAQRRNVIESSIPERMYGIFNFLRSNNKQTTLAQARHILQITGEVIFLILQMLWLTLFEIYTLFKPIAKKSVKNEIVLVTGAGHGIGKELALQYASEGAVVVCWDINLEGMNSTLDEISKLGYPKAHAYLCDVASRDAVLTTAAKVKQEVGDVTILINNAGIMPTHSFFDHTVEEIERIMNINVMAHFWTLQAFLPDMIKHNHGHIVALSSVAGLAGQKNLVPYSTAKFAVRGMMESLNLELRTNPNSKIRFTTICPYMVNTGLCKKPIIRFESLMPMLNPKTVAKFIVDSQRRNEVEITIPTYLMKVGHIVSNANPDNEQRGTDAQDASLATDSREHMLRLTVASLARDSREHMLRLTVASLARDSREHMLRLTVASLARDSREHMLRLTVASLARDSREHMLRLTVASLARDSREHMLRLTVASLARDSREHMLRLTVASLARDSREHMLRLTVASLARDSREHMLRLTVASLARDSREHMLRLTVASLARDSREHMLRLTVASLARDSREHMLRLTVASLARDSREHMLRLTVASLARDSREHMLRLTVASLARDSREHMLRLTVASLARDSREHMLRLTVASLARDSREHMLRLTVASLARDSREHMLRLTVASLARDSREHMLRLTVASLARDSREHMLRLTVASLARDSREHMLRLTVASLARDSREHMLRLTVASLARDSREHMLRLTVASLARDSREHMLRLTVASLARDSREHMLRLTVASLARDSREHMLRLTVASLARDSREHMLRLTVASLARDSREHMLRLTVASLARDSREHMLRLTVASLARDSREHMLRLTVASLARDSREHMLRLTVASLARDSREHMLRLTVASLARDSREHMLRLTVASLARDSREHMLRLTVASLLRHPQAHDSLCKRLKERERNANRKKLQNRIRINFKESLRKKKSEETTDETTDPEQNQVTKRQGKNETDGKKKGNLRKRKNKEITYDPADTDNNIDSDPDVLTGQGSPDSPDAECMFCQQLFSGDIQRDMWIHCLMCGLWAHNDCVGLEFDIGICDFCK
ncbi:hypothetical protein FQA39_LY01191 [Lamprigera yunnana]|nr:hypothetical protein FQA39_LY01191 [Lamprigera yunnana]